MGRPLLSDGSVFKGGIELNVGRKGVGYSRIKLGAMRPIFRQVTLGLVPK